MGSYEMTPGSVPGADITKILEEGWPVRISYWVSSSVECGGSLPWHYGTISPASLTKNAAGEVTKLSIDTHAQESVYQALIKGLVCDDSSVTSSPTIFTATSIGSGSGAWVSKAAKICIETRPPGCENRKTRELSSLAAHRPIICDKEVYCSYGTKQKETVACTGETMDSGECYRTPQPCRRGFYCNPGSQTPEGTIETRVDGGVSITFRQLGEFTTDPFVGSLAAPVGDVYDFKIFGGPETIIQPNACPEGHFCPTSTRGSKANCEVDSYFAQGRFDRSCCTSSLQSNGDYICTSDNRCVNVATEMLCTCPKGYACPKGSEQPHICPPGTYQDQVGQATCRSCVAGTYCNGFGNMAETICQAGFVCGTAGTQLLSERCPRGFYCFDGVSSNVGPQCTGAPGTMSCNWGGDEPAVPPSFADCSGVDIPSECVGATGLAIYECAANKLETLMENYRQRNSESTTRLMSCAACEFDGLTGCSDCESKGLLTRQSEANIAFSLTASDEGWMCVLQKFQRPVPCAPGTFCLFGVRSPFFANEPLVPATATAEPFLHPQKCAPGSYCARASDKAVGSGNCPKGHFCGEWSIEPLKTPPGSFASTTDNKESRACIPGFFAAGWGRHLCSKAPAGHVAPSIGGLPRNDTAICRAGYVCDVPGRAVETKRCPAGHYCLEGTNSDCTIYSVDKELGVLNRSLFPKGLRGGSIVHATGGTPFTIDGQPCPEGTYCSFTENIMRGDPVMIGEYTFRVSTDFSHTFDRTTIPLEYIYQPDKNIDEIVQMNATVVPKRPTCPKCMSNEHCSAVLTKPAQEESYVLVGTELAMSPSQLSSSTSTFTLTVMGGGEIMVQSVAFKLSSSNSMPSGLSSAAGTIVLKDRAGSTRSETFTSVSLNSNAGYAEIAAPQLESTFVQGASWRDQVYPYAYEITVNFNSAIDLSSGLISSTSIGIHVPAMLSQSFDKILALSAKRSELETYNQLRPESFVVQDAFQMDLFPPRKSLSKLFGTVASTDDTVNCCLRPIPCQKGTFCQFGVKDPFVSFDQSVESKPHWCSEGRYCPDGSQGANKDCPSGFYCPRGSGIPRPCWKGHSCSLQGNRIPSMCPKGTYSRLGTYPPFSIYREAEVVAIDPHPKWYPEFPWFPEGQVPNLGYPNPTHQNLWSAVVFNGDGTTAAPKYGPRRCTAYCCRSNLTTATTPPQYPGSVPEAADILCSDPSSTECVVDSTLGWQTELGEFFRCQSETYQEDEVATLAAGVGGTNPVYRYYGGAYDWDYFPELEKANDPLSLSRFWAEIDGTQDVIMESALRTSAAKEAVRTNSDYNPDKCNSENQVLDCQNRCASVTEWTKFLDPTSRCLSSAGVNSTVDSAESTTSNITFDFQCAAFQCTSAGQSVAMQDLLNDLVNIKRCKIGGRNRTSFLCITETVDNLAAWWSRQTNADQLRIANLVRYTRAAPSIGMLKQLKELSRFISGGGHAVDDSLCAIYYENQYGTKSIDDILGNAANDGTSFDENTFTDFTATVMSNLVTCGDGPVGVMSTGGKSIWPYDIPSYRLQLDDTGRVEQMNIPQEQPIFISDSLTHLTLNYDANIHRFCEHVDWNSAVVKREYGGCTWQDTIWRDSMGFDADNLFQINLQTTKMQLGISSKQAPGIRQAFLSGAGSDVVSSGVGTYSLWFVLLFFAVLLLFLFWVFLSRPFASRSHFRSVILTNRSDLLLYNNIILLKCPSQDISEPRRA